MITSIQSAFHGGGIWMYPILMCGLWGVAITVERIFALYVKLKEDKNGLLRGLNNHVMRGDINGAIRFLSSQKQGPIARVLKAGLLKVHSSDFEVQAALDGATLREVPEIEKRVGFLAVLSNAATLCGLLGTIIGMIHCFSAVAHVDPAQKATILAGGISEAMNCTAFGLIVAIPALFAYGILQGTVQHMIDGLNESVVAELNMVMSNRRLFANQPVDAAEASPAK